MRKLIVFMLVLISASSWSQKKDAMFWTGFGIELPINKKITVDFKSQLRLDNNFSRYSQLFGEFSGSYKLAKGLKAGVLYRYSRKNKGDYYANENRFCVDVRYKLDLVKGLDLKFRARYQFAFDRLSAVNGVNPRTKNLFRFSTGLKYRNKDFKRVQPYVSAELFFPFRKNDSGDALDTYRFRVGLMFDLPKKHSLKVFYMYEYENRSVDNINHIYGLTYGYTFKSLHKKGNKNDSEGTSGSPD